MAKKRTPEQAAIRDAWNAPARRWHISRRMCWANARWPFRVMFFTDWNNTIIELGETTRWKRHGATAPIAWLAMSLNLWPFGLIVFKGEKRILWLGDRKWKREING